MKCKKDHSPEDQKESDEYFVEKILEKRVIGNEAFYLIKWADYDIIHSTWEPLSNLYCVQLVEEFEEALRAESMIDHISSSSHSLPSPNPQTPTSESLNSLYPTPESSIPPSPTPQSPIPPSPTPQSPIPPSPIPQSPIPSSPTPHSTITPSPTTQSPITPSPTPQSPINIIPMARVYDMAYNPSPNTMEDENLSTTDHSNSDLDADKIFGNDASDDTEKNIAGAAKDNCSSRDSNSSRDTVEINLRNLHYSPPEQTIPSNPDQLSSDLDSPFQFFQSFGRDRLQLISPIESLNGDLIANIQSRCDDDNIGAVNSMAKNLSLFESPLSPIMPETSNLFNCEPSSSAHGGRSSSKSRQPKEKENDEIMASQMLNKQKKKRIDSENISIKSKNVNSKCNSLTRSHSEFDDNSFLIKNTPRMENMDIESIDTQQLFTSMNSSNITTEGEESNEVNNGNSSMIDNQLPEHLGIICSTPSELDLPSSTNEQSPHVSVTSNDDHELMKTKNNNANNGISQSDQDSIEEFGFARGLKLRTIDRMFPFDSNLYYAVYWEGHDDMDLVSAKDLNKRNPKESIKFLEKNIGVVRDSNQILNEVQQYNESLNNNNNVPIQTSTNLPLAEEEEEEEVTMEE